MSKTNCLPCTPKLPLQAVERLNVLDGASYRRQLKNCSIKRDKLEPENSLVLFETKGQGAIRTLFLALTGSTASIAANSRISIFIDDEKSPSITGTVANLFLSGLEGKKVNGDFAGKTVYDQDGRRISHYRYLFIPYYCSCRIEMIAEEGGFLEDIQADMYYQEDYKDDTVAFGRYSKAHSVEKRGQESEHGKAVELACIKGKGALHSIQFSMCNPDTRGSYMEGNIEIYLDGNKFPEYQSSGTEEFFMAGVYFMNLHQSAYSGCTRSFNDGSINPENISTAHRLFIEDPITFERELKIIWHNGEIGQGVRYAGATTYDFHAIYYTEYPQVLDTSTLPIDQATYRIHALDNGFYDVPLKSAVINSMHIKDETVLIDISGSGAVSSIFIDCSGENMAAWENALLSFEVDGKRTGSVPLALFFMNAPDTAYYVGQFAGRTGPGVFFRYVNIAYNSRLRIIIENPSAPFTVSGRIEYKHGKEAGNGFFGMAGTNKSIAPGETIDLLTVSGAGILEGVTVDLSGEGAYDGQFALYIDESSKPAIVTGDVSSFFLSGYNFAGGIGASSSIGVLHSGDGRVAAFRCFIKDPVTFRCTLRLTYTARKPVEINSAVNFRTERVEKLQAATMPDFLVRLNLLDGAKGIGYGLCYSAMEALRGRIEPGQTCILFEDFAPGSLRCIRLGTPRCGRQLLAAEFKIYLDGLEDPVVDTTVGRFFSANFEDAIYWSGSRYISRPSKRVGFEGGKGDHASAFRYLMIPYRKGIKVTITAPEFGAIGGFMQVYYQGGTGIPADFGRYEKVMDATFTGDVPGGAKVELANIQGMGALTSVQCMIENQQSDKYLDGLVAFYVDGEQKPSITATLSQLFMAGRYDLNNTEYIDGYSELWKEKRAEENGHFTTAYVGWPHRNFAAPYRSTMYRLFVKDPIVFNKSLRVTWYNAAESVTNLKTDLIVSRGQVQ